MGWSWAAACGVQRRGILRGFPHSLFVSSYSQRRRREADCSLLFFVCKMRNVTTLQMTASAVSMLAPIIAPSNSTPVRPVPCGRSKHRTNAAFHSISDQKFMFEGL